MCNKIKNEKFILKALSFFFYVRTICSDIPMLTGGTFIILHASIHISTGLVHLLKSEGFHILYRNLVLHGYTCLRKNKTLNIKKLNKSTTFY